MVRRAVTAATLAFAAALMPCLLLAAPQAATATTSAATVTAGTSAATATTSVGQGTSTVSVAITGMSQRWASPGSTLIVSGTLTNSTARPVSQPLVQLQSSSSTLPLSGGIANLQTYAEGHGPFPSNVPGATWQSRSELAPGSSQKWSIRLSTRRLSVTGFGVYPLAAQVDSGGITLDTDYSFLPYEPARHGAFASSRPAPKQIAWAWPLIDKPLLGAPYRHVCGGPQVTALAASLRTGGRLFDLLSVGAGGPGGSVASAARVTWAVDPALLDNVQALAGCGKANRAGAQAAKHWLTELNNATVNQPLFVTPYADVNVAALGAHGFGSDVKQAFTLGWNVAHSVLKRCVNPPGPGEPVSGCPTSGPGKPAAITQPTGNPVTGFAWPADGIDGRATLAALRVNGISTVLTDSASMPQTRSSVVRAPSGEVGDITVLLANNALTQALRSTGGTQAANFAAEQLFLADTAVLASAHPSEPIIVAPPRRWQPSADLATGLLSETATAPWLRPASLPAVAAARHVPTVTAGSSPSPLEAPLGRQMRDQLRSVDSKIAAIQSFRLLPNPNLWLAAATIESSFWDGPAAKEVKDTDPLAQTVRTYAGQQNGVDILADRRITLGGLKSKVPVSIDNKLDYGVRVILHVRSGSDLTIQSGSAAASRAAIPVTVGGRNQTKVELHVQASQTGSSSITMWLTSPSGRKPLAPALTITVQATQLGLLAVIIMAVALGVFLIAAAARAVRRGRVAPADAGGPGPATGEAEPNAAQADTVVGERTELRPAGKTGL